MVNEAIRTIEDMENLFYSAAGAAFIGQEEGLISIQKADAPVVTTTTGVYNAVYGAQAWVQLNLEANTFGVLPKTPWKKSGWRVITARAGSRGAGGLAEGAVLPDTIKPTFQEVSTKPKTVAQTFEASEVQEFIASETDDDAFGAMNDLRGYMATQHRDEINYELNGQNGAPASSNLESIDRVVASYAEVAATYENNESTTYTTNDVDIFGLDRDGGATFSDAYVNIATSGGVVRSLNESVINAVIQNTLNNGANREGQMWQTGYDTWVTINQLYESQVRYALIGSAEVGIGVNGISTQPGIKVGLQVSTLMNRPVIESKDTVLDTGGITRLYCLDLSNPEGFDNPRLHLNVAKPTQYFEAGMNSNTPFAVAKLTTKGMYRTMAEVKCNFFAVQGKARDLKA